MESQNLNVHIISDSVYWNKVTPIDFLDTLKKYPSELFLIEVEPKVNWYKNEYIIVLKSYYRCKKKCGGVASYYISKKITFVNTTIGHQARYIVESFNYKRFPHSMSSLK